MMTAVMQSSRRSARSTAHATCPKCMHEFDLALAHALPNVGINQFSPYMKWQGQNVTELQYKILRVIHKTTQSRLERGLDENLRLSEAEIVRRVWGHYTAVSDPNHALRQQVYRLRRKLKGWRIDRNLKGYIIVEEGA